jgi:uncharacterized protein
MIELEPRYLAVVRDILRRHAQGYEVWVFGSRAKGGAKPYSDLDLLFCGDAPVPTLTMGDLREAFDESSLPFQVDLADWHRIDDAFKEIIQEKHEVLVDPQKYASR